MLDVQDDQRIAACECGAVKLEAARQYRWDLKLAEFNNQALEVATIESMVGTPRR